MSRRVMSVLLSRNPKVVRTTKVPTAPAAPVEEAPAAAPVEEAPAPAPAEEPLTMSNTKAELLAEAEAKGVAIPSGATKADILEALYG